MVCLLLRIPSPCLQGESTNFASRYYGIQATYAAGQAVSIVMNFTANHAGRVSVRICPKPRAEVTQACFDDPAHQLTRVDGPFAGKRYLYLTGRETSVADKWQLPAGVSCPDGCMLQWVSI